MNFIIKRELTLPGSYKATLNSMEFVPAKTITKPNGENVTSPAMYVIKHNVGNNLITHRFFPVMEVLETDPGVYEEVMSPQSTEIFTNLILVPLMQQTGIECEDLNSFQEQIKNKEYTVVVTQSDRVNTQGVPYLNYSYTAQSVQLDKILGV